MAISLRGYGADECFSGAMEAGTVRSLVPARLDRLPWTRFHWRVITGLGAAWILDGLEITIVASVGTTLQDRGTLHLTTGDVGLLGSVYLPDVLRFGNPAGDLRRLFLERSAYCRDPNALLVRHLLPGLGRCVIPQASRTAAPSSPTRPSWWSADQDSFQYSSTMSSTVVSGKP